MTTSVAVIGATGYVGSRLTETLDRDPAFAVTAVTRADYSAKRSGTYDIVINAAMPAARYFARKHPARDFVETVEKTADIVHGWTAKRFVQVSSVSARCQLDTVYGRHKAAAERIVDDGENLIVRLASMYDRSLTKGVLIDMLFDRTVYVDGASRYCFAPLDWVTGWIAANLERRGVVEIGARDAIALEDVARAIGSRSTFEGILDHQEIPAVEPDFPDAAGVVDFLRTEGAALRSANT